MENGCPVLPKKIKVSDQVTKVEALILRAQQIAISLAQTDEDAAKSFLNNVDYLKALGDPMLEWLIESRERGLSAKDTVPKAMETDEFYSF